LHPASAILSSGGAFDLPRNDLTLLLVLQTWRKTNFDLYTD
jgi:hypothetical protein